MKYHFIGLSIFVEVTVLLWLARDMGLEQPAFTVNKWHLVTCLVFSGAFWALGYFSGRQK